MSSSLGECLIARELLVEALAQRQWLVSVFDGEEWALEQSDNFDNIWKAMRSTDEDTLVFHTREGERIGFVYLIWGNGDDLISDYTDRPTMSSFVEAIYKLAE